MPSIDISFGGYQGPGSIHTAAARAFGETLEKSLGDRVRFELEPDVLAAGHKSGDLLPMTAKGDFTLCYISTIRFSQTIPEFQLFELPFLMQDRAKIYRALDGELGDFFKQKIHAETPYRVLGFWDNGFRHVTNRVRAIHTPHDCKGIRIRTQMSDFIGTVFRTIGFEPVAMDIKFFLEKIGTDEIDAQENPLTTIYNFKVHEFHRYITLTGHIFGVTLLLCNAEIYGTWPYDVTDAVEAAAQEATRTQRELATAEDKDVLAKLDPDQNEIIHLTAAERAAFVDAVTPLLNDYRDKLGPNIFGTFD